MNHYKTLSDLHRGNGWALPENPLISLVRCDKTCTFGNREFTSDFYMIGFKKLKSGIFVYGKTRYDHDNGSMSFIRPRQVIEMKDLEFDEDGFIIFFHEDFLSGHALFNEIKTYNYFDYEINEALHLSPREEGIIWDLHDRIHAEYHNNEDEYSRNIIIGHIASILMYAQRFYKRQFINRSDLSGKTITRFNESLAEYFKSGMQGLPSVNQLAAQLHLSPRYLSDLLKQETGKTAIELIHIYLISEAKNMLKSGDQSVSEIAYHLGFESVSYFSKLFKQETGIRPLQFKKQILN
jgi:AraC family transcriptional activator of pobA